MGGIRFGFGTRDCSISIDAVVHMRDADSIVFNRQAGCPRVGKERDAPNLACPRVVRPAARAPGAKRPELREVRSPGRQGRGLPQTSARVDASRYGWW